MITVWPHDAKLAERNKPGSEMVDRPGHVATVPGSATKMTNTYH